ncbi:OmpA family protein [Brachyspira hyodysenteriae]|uniref:Cell envelope biogenesis protein OmpA n=1 Tax=Brachyspira hyodysenteriae ATCC 27164 TaxID=1266923 RepID=A0A3B6VY48_BRAHO|nr:OmpA family protein [Brachyspira hyodysenteriae]ANN63647.1 cell envelope biogenesis protein OmpA [Brachyspira hyodysenteriae ATCC 27164]AUJ49980.1 cell envelope biogenesis protein OmpA [Brachyspira hyodysenteriae]KLI20212.1 cell envelope biogenesis protein OmpA [Brachyspira hyodysenteriae]KLI23688.1 cell envelope biogenesis protein OmpA [Brachyspira hyodysenteriae]KLI28199.1 cell envelope biogenesis protein OmpA [Brachyspira hyodysenteriae]
MKKLLFIFSLLIFVIAACKSTPTSTTPEDVVIADDPAPAVAEEEPKPEEVVADTKTLASGSEELYLPMDTSIRDTERGRILETTPKVIFKFVETNMPATAEMSFNQVVEFLEKNPNVNIVLEAHTSNRGKAYPYNYNLSVVRAKNGKAYLLAKGIPSERVIESPLGEALPEYPTQNELRRYEFVIIANDEDLVKYNTYISNLDVRNESTYQGN